jgi:molybdopterin-guanine dinucleotide biosynthesis protein A
MPKQSMAWHENAFKKYERYLKEQEQRARRILKQLETERVECERYRAQIERAKRERRDGFDAERFLPKKGGE